MTPVPQDQENSVPMDGLAPSVQPAPIPAPAPTPAPQAPEQPVKAAGVQSGGKRLAIVIQGLFFVFYLGFFCWEGFLLLTLPSPTGEMRDLQSMGVLTSLVGIGVLLLVGWLGVLRIGHSNVSTSLRQRSLIVLIAILAPGVVLAMATPYFITREPPLGIDVVNPTKASDFVAPVSVTYSVERAMATLKNLGYRPSKYQWDGNGDGKMDQETVVPTFTALYPKQGAYLVTVIIQFDGSSARRLQKRLNVPTAVFSVIPEDPVVEKPARFSIASLLTDPKQLKQVTWNFGDGTKQETLKTTEITHTYFTTGEYEVSAVFQLASNAEQSLKRTIAVKDPVPLPFPITLSVEPKNPMGPAPFGAVFKLDTKEPIREVIWDFGDGKEERGTDLFRAGHTFDDVGIYPVVVKARSASGSLAELTQIVRVTETLQLQDLRFEGSPEVQGGKVQGELPLDVEITPKTAIPLVTFFWESEDDSANVQGTTYRATYRQEGTYAVTLVAQNADGNVARIPLSILVKPASAEPSITAKPENGVAPLTVQFDASESYIPPDETLAGFKWLFGDEERNDSVELGPSRVEHTYKKPGEYKVILKLVTVSGKEFSTERTIVVRRPALSACITSSRTKVQAGKGIEFDSACSTGFPLTFVWDVRADANPKVTLAQGPTAKYIHVFDAPGTYTVSLTLTDEWGNDDSTSVPITVTP